MVDYNCVLRLSVFCELSGDVCASDIMLLCVRLHCILISINYAHLSDASSFIRQIKITKQISILFARNKYTKVI